uniref:ZP domain-containing protein n=1 Tax=Angiostrongylus cantonensis TaxID=6313 RepID=A0A158PBP0_ANGCA
MFRILGEPEVQCGSDSITLLFNARNPFSGKIFVKVSDCVMMGNMKLNHRFTVKHESCGVRRQREVNGVVIISTVIVSFHSIFITKVDRAYRLSCFYVEGTKRVQQQLDVAALTTQLLESQTQLPICRYDILSDGPNGIPVKYGRIGEMVFHKWTCVSELIDVYCMRVHSCTVYDGQGGSAVTVIDVNGCSVDSIILQNIDYLDDMTAGKLAQVFKFADRATLYFNCQIQLTIKDKQYGCSLSTIGVCSSLSIIIGLTRTFSLHELYMANHPLKETRYFFFIQR